jgi:uncharacterized protein YraI
LEILDLDYILMRYDVIKLPGTITAMKSGTDAPRIVRGALVSLGLVMAATTYSSTVLAQENGPEYFQVKMKPGSTLNVRKDPSLKSQKIGSLQAGTAGISNLGCHVGMPYLEWRNSTTAIRKVETRRKWCNIEYNGMVGWTAGKYLAEDQPE